MSIDRFVSIVGATLNSFGVLFLFLGTFRFITSDLSLVLPATPYGGSNLDRLKKLSRQRGNTISGLILISIALMVQILQLIVTHEPWEILDGYDRIALTLALSFGTLLVLVVFRWRISFSRRTVEKAKRAVMKGHLMRAFNQNPLGRAQWSSVVESAEILLGITRPVGEPIEMFLRKIARELEVKFPLGLQIEDERTKSPTLGSARARASMS